MSEIYEKIKGAAEEISTYFIATSHPSIIGDGINDDTLGIQELLNFAKTSGIRIVFPPGHYRLTAPLRLYSNTFIDAQKGVFFSKEHNGAILLNLLSTDEMEEYRGNGNITIKGGEWNANYPNYTGGTSFVLAHAKGILVEDVSLINHGGGHAIEFNAICNGAVMNSKFLGFDDLNGSRTYSEAIQLDLAKNSSVFPWGGSSYDHTPCKNIIIENNFFGSSNQLGAWGRAVGSHSATYGKWHENVIIKNNIVNDCLQWAFRAYSWRDVIIEGNMIYNCGGGIGLDVNNLDDEDSYDEKGNYTGESNDCERIIVKGNLIDGGGSYASAISADGNDTAKIRTVTILNNSINNYNNRAVYLRLLDEVLINNNVFNNIHGTGLTLSETWMVTVSSNLFRSIRENGITCFTGNRAIIISNNNFNYIREHGVWVSGSDTVNISGNNFIGIGYLEKGFVFQGIRITSGAQRITVTGNTFRQWSNTYAMNYAIYVTATVTESVLCVNNMAGIPIQFPANIHEYGNLSLFAD
ncbi:MULTISPECIES: right-handed parallel beta-helix repeat-containing protein [Oceanobacillus]|uniref:Pectate lyase superfamily protein domain-containing protein n=1 Tax=Oceanobacillus kimchii TaxID=746691 RepID=A0ABQ5TIU6_9BACI|nr:MULTISPECIES: right-handed parallel beta-helix repeat-containing protein [Oceanobacillus]MBT2653261.1 right-handed parallel beta-helix repeat-containing protein [Oceanobacillus sp. ISL-73]OEH53960.1 hypothetical protein AQ616_15960 [Oceanobacillus sp. E9]GLO64407.1 hypothetical protein MACH08_01910 [Oceanobacillus kimchii]